MKIPRLRWIIAGLLFLATALNYIDRQALGVVSEEIQRDLRFSSQEYYEVTAFFFLAYAIMYAGSGYIVDRLGTRLGFAVFIFSWSLSQILHAFAFDKRSLTACRFLLGLSEPGNWPAAAKAIAEWFPPSQRALGVGIFNAGSSVGSTLSAPLVAAVTLAYGGWRAAFVATGAMGLVWLAAWWVLYAPPHANRWLPAAEYAQLKDQLPPPRETRPAAETGIDWKRIIAARGCWSLILARFFTDPVIYFVIFSLPKFLRQQYGWSLQDVGRYSWVPYVFGGAGYVAGGWLSGRLITSGWPLPRSRKFVMALGAALLPAAIFAPFAPAAWMALGATCLITLGHAFWVANLQALPTDLFPGHEVATASGFTGMGGAIGGMLAQLGTGYLVAHFSFKPVFAIAGLMHPLSALLVYWLLPDREFKRAA